MIEMRDKQGLLCSYFVCDECHEPITKVNAAMVAILDCFDHRLGTPFTIRHVHKGKCQQAIEARAGRSYGDLEMRDHIASLLVNIGWSKADYAAARGNWGNDFTEGSDDE